MLKIKDVKYDSDAYGGCPTCDYGSSYISNIEIIFEDDTRLSIETDQMYEYMVSESDYMQILASENNTIDEIVLKLLEIVKEKYGDSKSYPLKSRIGLEDMKITVNKTQIDILKTLKNKKIVYEKEEAKDE